MTEEAGEGIVEVAETGLMAADAVEDEEIFSAIYDDLRRFAALVGRVGDDPDDLVQEALARVLAKRTLASLEDPARYVRVVITRVASNNKRKAARGDRARRRLEHRSPSEQRTWEVEDRLERLAPRERAVLYLSIVEDLDSGRIAEMLGMRPGAVRTAKTRALKRLRAIEESSNDD